MQFLKNNKLDFTNIINLNTKKTKMKKLISTECVSYGHPDKMADQISDAILDAYVKVDPSAKVAVETMIKDNVVVLGGEVSCKDGNTINISEVVRDVMCTFPFSAEHNLSADNIKIINLIGRQSPEINGAVFKCDGEIGAGDQGLMLGYASNDTPNYMPLGMYLARRIVESVVEIDGLGPDAKSQITIEEDEIGNKRVHTILISTMQSRDITLNMLKHRISESVLSNKSNQIDEKIFKLIDDKTIIHINPAGEWNVGGPVSDCGITGRKIVVDQYGPYCAVGGGAFSSKDASKSDRSAAYLARYIAKNIVAAGIYNNCTVELAYAISMPKPISIRIDGGCKNDVDNEKLTNIVKEIFPMTPNQIIKKFDMRRPIYFELARFGHFGIIDENRKWEELDMVDKLKEMYYKK